MMYKVACILCLTVAAADDACITEQPDTAAEGAVLMQKALLRQPPTGEHDNARLEVQFAPAPAVESPSQLETVEAAVAEKSGDAVDVSAGGLSSIPPGLVDRMVMSNPYKCEFLLDPR